MIGRAIALDAADETARHFVVQNADIDAITRNTHLRESFDATLGELSEDLPFEGGLRITQSSSEGALEAAMLSVRKELPQQPRAVGGRCGGAYPPPRPRPEHP